MYQKKQQYGIFIGVFLVVLVVFLTGCTKKQEQVEPTGFAITLHKVSDFAKWKAGFDSQQGGPERGELGGIESYIFRVVDDTNLVAVLNVWDTMENLQKFINSAELKEAFKMSGVVGEAKTYFLEQVEKGNIQEEGFKGEVWALTMLQVEDFAKWKADFDGSIEFRKQGGQGAFQIFRTVSDTNHVALLIEWDSLENAQSFLQSDGLKEANKRSGVTEMSTPYILKKAGEWHLEQ